MTIFYLATRPETVVSIIQVGRLPDNLSEYFGAKQIACFKDILPCILDSKTSAHQTFILLLELPKPIDSKLLTSVSEQNKKPYIIAKQINSAWIKRIFVYSKRSEKLITRLFNNECPKPIEIKPEIYPSTLSTLVSHPIEGKTVDHPIEAICTKQGDLLGSTMQTLVNTVNCVGVMGKGIALAFKERYPAMFKEYKDRCKQNKVKLGEPYLYKLSQKRWILNFPTKGHWKNLSNINEIENGLKFLSKHASAWGITSLALPPLGCGNGGLNWEEVYPLIRKHLDPLEIPIEIYAPFPRTKADNHKTASKKHSIDFFSKNNKNNSFLDPSGIKKSKLSTSILAGKLKHISRSSIMSDNNNISQPKLLLRDSGEKDQLQAPITTGSLPSLSFSSSSVSSAAAPASPPPHYSGAVNPLTIV